MSDAPTPETDAAILNLPLWQECDDPIEVKMIHPDFARRLERERDEARRERDEILQTYRNIINEDCGEYEQHCTCVLALRVEIDRLRARVAELEAAGICQWWENYDGDYESSCGEIWTFSNDAGLAGNNFNFCHKCGKRIEQIEKEANHG